MTFSVVLSPAEIADSVGVAELHASEIDQGFLASLGVGFLDRLYRRMMQHRESFLLVARAASQPGSPPGVCGFVAGTERTAGLYAEFLRRDGLAAAFAARRRFRAIGQAWETLRYAGESSIGRTGLPAAELLSLAVAPGQRGQGVGRALVAGFLAELRHRGVASARVTVASDNRAALRLYQAGGFRPAGRLEVHRGHPSEVLVWSA